MRFLHFRTARASRLLAIRGLDKDGDLTKTVRVRTLINLAFAHKVDSVRPKCLRALISEFACYTNQPSPKKKAVRWIQYFSGLRERRRTISPGASPRNGIPSTASQHGRRARVHFIMGNAYRDIMALAAGQHGDTYTDSATYEPEDANARTKAVAEYRAGLLVDEKSDTSRIAKERLRSLQADEAPDDTSFYCQMLD